MAIKILNIKNLNPGSSAEILRFCQQKIKENEGAFLIPMNPIKVIKARKSRDFQEIIDHADWVFPDAWGMKWAAFFLFRQRIPLTPGYQLMLSLLNHAENSGQSIYLLGTTEEILEIAVSKLRKTHPRLRISGTHHGFFSGPEEDRIFGEIKEAKPGYVFVAMGEYKQERIIKKLKELYPQAIYLGVGGTIDLIAQKQPSPSDWVRKHHLEWLFRILRQPFRLPRFKALPIFVFLVTIEKVKLGIS